jgi:predicted DNA binding CopG/RHH family protein
MKEYIDHKEKSLIEDIEHNEGWKENNSIRVRNAFIKAAKTTREARITKQQNIRLDSNDINLLKAKAEKAGLRYQTYIKSELHKLAHKK